MSPDLHTIEGIARVVRVEGAVAWLEPEQTKACGGCAAASACLPADPGTIAERLATRRFAIENSDKFAIGERVMVGVNDGALLRAALTAYALPLAAMLTAGGLAEAAFGSDLISMAAMLAGLGFGLVAAHLAARRLAARGDLTPLFLRRATVSLPPKSPDGDLPPGGQKHLGRPCVFPRETCATAGERT